LTETIHCCEDLASYFHFRRNQLGISNETLEQICGMTKGHADKLLGPAKVKNLSQFTIDCLLSALAVKLIAEPDVEGEAKMRPRWEGRNQSQVRAVGRVAPSVMQRVRPHLFRELGRAGGLKRAASMPAKQRRQIARTAAIARWKLHRAAVKARADARAAEQSP
jgi:hypothetical protein